MILKNRSFLMYHLIPMIRKFPKFLMILKTHLCLKYH
jgi:hypothetical protein